MVRDRFGKRSQSQTRFWQIAKRLRSRLRKRDVKLVRSTIRTIIIHDRGADIMLVAVSARDSYKLDKRICGRIWNTVRTMIRFFWYVGGRSMINRDGIRVNSAPCGLSDFSTVELLFIFLFFFFVSKIYIFNVGRNGSILTRLEGKKGEMLESEERRIFGYFFLGKHFCFEWKYFLVLIFASLDLFQSNLKGKGKWRKKRVGIFFSTNWKLWFL